MAKYRLTKGTHSALIGGKGGRRVEYQAGVEGKDVMELTDAQAKLPHLRKRIEKYYGPESENANAHAASASAATAIDLKPDEDEDDVDPKIAGVLAGNVDQVLAYINGHSEDDKTLEAMRTAEKGDKNRKTVLDALNELLGE